MLVDRDFRDSGIFGGLQAGVPINAHRLILSFPCGYYDRLRFIVLPNLHILFDYGQQFGSYRKQGFEALVCLYFFGFIVLIVISFILFTSLIVILPVYDPGLAPCGVQRAESWLVP